MKSIENWDLYKHILCVYNQETKHETTAFSTINYVCDVTNHQNTSLKKKKTHNRNPTGTVKINTISVFGALHFSKYAHIINFRIKRQEGKKKKAKTSSNQKFRLGLSS